MNRRSKVWIVVLLLLPGCAVGPKALPDMEPKIPSVAVLEFEDHDVERAAALKGLGRTLSDQILQRLSERPDLRLIDRESLQKILEELSLSSRDLVDKEGQLRLGKFLGAQYLVMGGFTSLGGVLRIDGRVVEVERGVTEGNSIEGHVTERAVLEKRFSDRMAEQLMLQIGPPKGRPKTAQEHFLQGVFMEQSNHQKALELYETALSIDPRHEEARERMESLLLKEMQ